MNILGRFVRNRLLLVMGLGALVVSCEKKKLIVNQAETQQEITDAYQQVEKAYRLFYGVGGEKRDKKAAFVWAEKAAKQGHPIGLYYCGMMVNSDYSREFFERTACAKEYFAKAKEAGLFTKAKPGEYLWKEVQGSCYYYGRTVEKNLKEAKRCYEEVVAHVDSPIANMNLAILHSEIPGYSVAPDQFLMNRYLLRAVQLKSDGAMFLLGDSYFYGKGVKRDLAKAKELYQEGEALGSAQCAVGLAKIAREEENFPEAIKWYRRGIELGDGQTAYYLAQMYASGSLGLTSNDAEEYRLYQTSYRLGGEMKARMAMSWFEFWGRGGAVQNREASFALWKQYGEEALRTKKESREASHAAFNLGDCYERGIMVEKNLEKAKQLYQVAADMGSGNAEEALERLKDKK